MRGPQVMQGYWSQPEEFASTIQDGWLYTGDMARQDEDGYFYIVDRKKDLILVGGLDVYPREVEEALYENEKVQEVVVVGIPDPHRGEIVKAYVVLKPDTEASEEELRRFCAERLAAYKVPVRIEFRESLPKSGVGKYLSVSRWKKRCRKLTIEDCHRQSSIVNFGHQSMVSSP